MIDYYLLGLSFDNNNRDKLSHMNVSIEIDCPPLSTISVIGKN